MSWDITYLPISVRGVCLDLYLVVDVWSRKIVAGDIEDREDGAMAADLIRRAGPRVSKDNPFSEALFRTAKYRPDYPSRPFVSKEEACQWAAAFVEWYVHEHRHSAIRLVTPQQRYSGAAAAIGKERPANAIAIPATMVTNHPLLEPTGCCVDQSTHRLHNCRRWFTHPTGCLNRRPPRTSLLKVTG